MLPLYLTEAKHMQQHYVIKQTKNPNISDRASLPFDLLIYDSISECFPSILMS